MTSGETAAALKTTETTVHRWVKTGRIKPLRTAGGAYVFTAEEVARVAALPKLRRGRKRRTPQSDQLPGTTS